MPRQFVDYEKESRPYWFYQRVAVLHVSETVVFDVPQGYHYLVKQISATWDSRDAGVTYQSPDPLLEITQIVISRNLQSAPYPLPLISSPAAPGVVWQNVVASAVDLQGFGRCLTAAAPRLYKTQNAAFQARSNILLRLSGFALVSAVNPDLNHPSYIDVILEGRLHPVGKGR